MKLGALLMEELIALWRSVVDPNYGRRFVEAGEGQGFEAYTQAFEQYRAVSEAIDVTTQALYILPSSRQTNPPAGGAARSTVELSFTRANAAMDIALVISPDVIVEEVADDFSPEGSYRVMTGRRFSPMPAVVLGPGQAGPVSATAIAVRSGYSFNHARVRAISNIDAKGAGSTNTGASIVPGVTSHQLVATVVPDVPVPDHVGKYVQLYLGSNAVQYRRVVGYVGPNVGSNGGTLLLAPTAQWSLQSQSDTYIVGETGTSANGRWIVWYCDANRIVVDRISGSAANNDVIVGDLSGAQAKLDIEEQSPDLLPETGTVGWRVVDFAIEFGLLVNNAAAPTGGRSAMLDLIGRERKVYRANGEDDDHYRKRVATPADVVSPNAIRRAANRVLAPLGYSATLRETGLPTMRGLYYDGDPNSVDPEIAFAYDLDFTVRPQDRFKLAMSYLEMRAFMMIEVPRIQLGDFGIAYDAGASNAYDAAPWFAFADGEPIESERVYRSIWQAVEEARAAGVTFDLVQVP